MTLSILITTVPERASLFAPLYVELCRQSEPFGEAIEILFDDRPRANKPGGVPIGSKRNDLLQRAAGGHVVFFDDDDLPMDWYVEDIMKALEKDPDSVGQLIKHLSNGRPAHDCLHSVRFAKWSKTPVHTEGFGMVYQRGTGHRNPVRRSIALQVGFPDLKWGEDEPYSNGVTALCKTEVLPERLAFIYRYSSKEPDSVKYGI